MWHLGAQMLSLWGKRCGFSRGSNVIETWHMVLLLRFWINLPITYSSRFLSSELHYIHHSIIILYNNRIIHLHVKTCDVSFSWCQYSTRINVTSQMQLITSATTPKRWLRFGIISNFVSKIFFAKTQGQEPWTSNSIHRAANENLQAS